MSRLRWAALALTVSCAPAAAPAPPPASQPPAIAPPATPAPLAEDSATPRERALQQKLGEALQYVSGVRGLSARTEVRGRLISRKEIERYISQQLDEETPEGVLEATEALLYGLGTVDADFNYRATVIGLMTSELLGFYDPKQKTFFVGGDLAGEEADVTLWHELVHALQDQHYDLTHVTDWQPDQGDSQAAVHALAEGDATSAMLDAMLKPRGVTALDVPESLMRTQSVLGAAALTAPPILVRSLLAPYIDGLAFTNALRRRGGFATVDEAWRAPPISTEQLLHPEKFLAHEVPLVVSLPPAPAHAPELHERFHDVMGEQTLRVLLEEWLPAKTAAEAASGWGGDRISVFSDEPGRRWAIGWHVRFDSVADAKQALEAFVRAAPLTERGNDQRLPPASPSKASDKLCRARHTQGPLALVRRGHDLAIAVGPFDRGAPPVEKDPGCPGALAWATQIATN